jgi:hypothetical protein
MSNFWRGRITKTFVLAFVCILLASLIVWAWADDLTTRLRIQKNYKAITLPPSLKLTGSEWVPRGGDNEFSSMVYEYTSTDNQAAIDQEFAKAFSDNGFNANESGAYANCSKNLSISRYMRVENLQVSTIHVNVYGTCQ